MTSGKTHMIDLMTFSGNLEVRNDLDGQMDDFYT